MNVKPPILDSSARSHALQMANELNPQEMNALVTLFAKGRYAEVMTLAQAMTVRHPLHGFGWKVLGTVLKQLGRVADALAPLQQAAALSPADAEVHSNLGVILKELDRLDEAEVSCRQALRIKPDFAEAHSNLGNTLKEMGRPDDAVACYQQALHIKPDFVEAHNNLGHTLNEMGRLDEAEVCYRCAVQIKPNFAAAHNNLGNTLKKLNRLDEAESSYRRALQIKPDFAEAHSNLGAILKGLGRLDEAQASCSQALQIKPNFAEAHNNLGNIFKEMGRLIEAEACYRRTLQMTPDFAEAHSNLGSTLKGMGRLHESEASCRQALLIKPDFAEAHNHLGNTLTEMGRLDEAEACYRKALEIKPDFAGARSNLLFIHKHLPDRSGTMLLAEARLFGDLVTRQARPYTQWRNTPAPDKCLRVGWVSGDLRSHPVGYFIEGLMAALHSNFAGKLELIAYPSGGHADALTARIKNCCQGWHSAVGSSDEILARQIREDGIDILIDLSGHTAYNRLPMFAWKPAPVQVTWLGYLGTTGVSAIDYLIADSWTLPATAEEHFSEKIWRLPQTYLCFTPPSSGVQVSALPAISNGFITFGCFNNLTKISNAVVALWARVLQSVPDSCLFLKAKQFNDAVVRQDFVGRFARHGIDMERLILQGSVPSRTEHLQTYQSVDIALDPFPYPGITTSIESLWMGVPVLTLAGNRFASRQGVGILTNAGLPDWIALDANDYVAKAIAHASDLPRLAMLRSGLRQQVLSSPLFDVQRFARHFEQALRSMWATWCRQR